MSAAARKLADAIPSFRFVVSVNDAPYGVFTECTLPIVEWDIQKIKEGGLNTSVHQLLGRRKETTMTLKNGIGTGKFVNWYIDTMNGKFEGGKNLRRKVTITLKDSLKNDVVTWHIENAFPTKWTGPQLKTSENSVAIQSLVLACGEITVTL